MNFNLTSASSIQDWQIGSAEILDSLNSDTLVYKDKCMQNMSKRMKVGVSPQKLMWLVLGASDELHVCLVQMFHLCVIRAACEVWWRMCSPVGQAEKSTRGWGQCHHSQQQRAIITQLLQEANPCYVRMGNDHWCNQVVVYLLDREGTGTVPRRKVIPAWASVSEEDGCAAEREGDLAPAPVNRTQRGSLNKAL